MSEIVMLPVGPIRKNPAQMRRSYDLGKLSELTLQIKARGFDADRPLLVRQVNGDGYEAIRGHRRRMATMMAAHLGDGEWDIEKVRQEWESFIQYQIGESEVTAEAVEAAAEMLAIKYGAVEVPAVIFSGEPKQAVLSLWSDNFGGEPPDPLGVAHSLLIGIREFGIMPDEAAAEMGQAKNYIETHLALAQIEPALAERIVRREISMTIATLLMSLASEEKREALTQFLMSLPGEMITVAKVKVLVKLLKELSFEMPLSFPHSLRRNAARAFLRLWRVQREDNPTRAYLAACVVLYARQEYTPPWEDVALLKEWLSALSVLSPAQNWGEALEPYLTEVSCKTCPIAKLPPQTLNVDLQALPCRNGYQVNRCLHGLAPDDPFHMRVPMAWEKHPGVQGEAGTYFVDSFTDLLTAYQAQLADEDVPAPPPAAPPATPPAKKTDKPAAKAPAKKADAKAPAAPPAPEPPTGPTPLEEMRASIALYMDLHETRDAGHVMASACGKCQHKLDKSPTSDPAVPACAWAAKLREVRFELIEPANAEEFKPIPVCRQYAPAAAWQEILPEYPKPVGLPRAWMLERIQEMADVNAGLAGWKPFQFLTGRPMDTSDYTRWFRDQLEQQKDSLSDGQIATLFVMAHGEWKRTKSFGDMLFHVPVNQGHTLAAAYLKKWEFGGDE
jgi:ParB-like chromosome segregation protein Spo0J